MDTLADVATRFQSFKAMNMDARRRELIRMGYAVDPATLMKITILEKWKELTFAEGPLF